LCVGQARREAARVQIRCVTVSLLCVAAVCCVKLASASPVRVCVALTSCLPVISVLCPNFPKLLGSFNAQCAAAGDIAFENVSFKYGDRVILDGAVSQSLAVFVFFAHCMRFCICARFVSFGTSLGVYSHALLTSSHCYLLMCLNADVHDSGGETGRSGRHQRLRVMIVFRISLLRAAGSGLPLFAWVHVCCPVGLLS
jgi:hypothetical protein